jgi:hypothetical protein
MISVYDIWILILADHIFLPYPLLYPACFSLGGYTFWTNLLVTCCADYLIPSLRLVFPPDSQPSQSQTSRSLQSLRKSVTPCVQCYTRERCKDSCQQHQRCSSGGRKPCCTIWQLVTGLLIWMESSCG